MGRAPRQQTLQPRILCRQRRLQQAVPVGQPISPAQDVPGAIVHRHHPAAPVELQDPNADIVEQPGERRLERPGIGQRLLDPHEVADIRQQQPDRLHLPARPAVPLDRIAHRPHDARAFRPVKAHMEAVPGTGERHGLVVNCRGLQFILGEQRASRDQLAVGKQPNARQTFVHGVVGLEIHALQVVPAFPAHAELRKEDADIVQRGPVAEDQETAARLDKLLDQSGGRQPRDIAERNIAERQQNALEQVLPVQDSTHPVRPSTIPATPCIPLRRSGCVEAAGEAFPPCGAVIASERFPLCCATSSPSAPLLLSP